MGRILLIGALAVFTIVQIAATGGTNSKMPKGENLFDYHLRGDSTKNDSSVIDSSKTLPERSVNSLLADSLGQIKAEELPVNLRLYSRAGPRKAYYVEGLTKKSEKEQKKELKRAKRDLKKSDRKKN